MNPKRSKVSGAAYDAVVFDLDGTLVDSAPAVRKIAARFLDELGAAPLSLEETRSFIGNGAAKFVERALEARGFVATGPLLNGHLRRFETLYAEDTGADNAPFPGIEAALSELKAAGVPLGICTNKPEAPTRNVLKHLGWTAHFAIVVTGDTLPVRKPDPEPLLYAAKKLNADAARLLFVGDSEVDAATAKAAGVSFALYLHGYRTADSHSLGADHLIDHYASLPATVMG